MIKTIITPVWFGMILILLVQQSIFGSLML